jgi:hypothetical protein
MSNLLDRSIIESLERMVADAPPAGPMPADHAVQRTANQPRRPWLLAAAAAIVLIGVAGIVTATTLGNDASAPAASSTLPSASPRPAGIFPYGGTQGAITARYATPIDAVNAYLAAITDPARLPEGFTVTARVADPQAIGTENPDHVVVRIALQTPDDTGDGYVTVQRIQDSPTAWQVTTAAVVGDETSDVRIVDGSLIGTIATGAGGSTTLYAYDLASGALLDSTTVTAIQRPDGTDPSAISFSLVVDDATQVGLRYWNTVAPAGGYQYSNFADRVIIGRPSSDDATVPTSAEPSTPTAPPTTEPSVVPLGDPGAGELTSFPVLDDVPEGLTATAYAQRTAAEDPWSEALVGRIIDDTATDLVAISVRNTPYDITPLPGRPPTTAEVFGQPASVYDYGTAPSGERIVHVRWGSGPYFLASGTDPLAFLTVVDQSALQATAPVQVDQAPTLSIGTLPGGFELLTDPQPRDHGTLTATLSIGPDNYDLSVSSRDPLVDMGQAGPLRRIDVGGRPGWTFDSETMTHDVAWHVSEDTYAYLKVNDGADLDDILVLAASYDFVDWPTFAARYEVQPPQAPAETSVPED